MKVLFTTNFPSMYRVDFFNELGKHCDLTVAYERRHAAHRNKKWLGTDAENFCAVNLDMRRFRRSQSIGFGIVNIIRQQPFDFIVFSGYSSPSVIFAVLYCQLKKIPYYFEYDGGFDEHDNPVIAHLKKRLLLPAAGHFITCKELEQYLKGIGVSDERLIRYPFSSVREAQMALQPPTDAEREHLRAQLGIAEEKVVLTVGQFIHRKGLDVLLKAAASLDSSTGIYFIGGKPTEDYLVLIDEGQLQHIHFIEFISHDELNDWYRACDVFVLPTRYDIWGLVINEAMANGIPIISTSRCVAATELISDGVNGYIVKPDEPELLAERIQSVLSNEAAATEMGRQGLERIRPFSIEGMAKAHYAFFEEHFTR